MRIFCPFQFNICLQFNWLRSSWSFETLWLDCWSFLHLRSSEWNVFFFYLYLITESEWRSSWKWRKKQINVSFIVQSMHRVNVIRLSLKAIKDMNKQVNFKWLIWWYTCNMKLSISLLIDIVCLCWKSVDLEKYLSKSHCTVHTSQSTLTFTPNVSS